MQCHLWAQLSDILFLLKVGFSLLLLLASLKFHFLNIILPMTCSMTWSDETCEITHMLIAHTHVYGLNL